MGGGIEVVAGHGVGPGYVADGGKGAERHRVAARIANLDLKNVLRIEPVGVLRLRRYAEGASQQIKVVDIVGAEISLQRSEHVGHVNAEHLRLGAVDIEVELGC